MTHENNYNIELEGLKLSEINENCLFGNIDKETTFIYLIDEGKAYFFEGTYVDVNEHVRAHFTEKEFINAFKDNMKGAN